MAVTIKDIAKRLGRSVGAVSRTFSRYAHVAGHTSEQTLAAARDTGYPPYPSASHMRKQTANAGGYAATKRLLSIPDPPDANLCVNDETAFGALHAMWQV